MKPPISSRFLTLLLISSHSCGPATIHNPQVNYWQARDIDGNNYKAVVIGEQVWFAENLKVTRFQNGDPIPNVTDSATWAGLGKEPIDWLESLCKKCHMKKHTTFNSRGVYFFI